MRRTAPIWAACPSSWASVRSSSPRTEVDANGNRITEDSEYQPITINGQPLVFRGTNRHDIDPVTGKYVLP